MPSTSERSAVYQYYNRDPTRPASRKQLGDVAQYIQTSQDQTTLYAAANACLEIASQPKLSADYRSFLVDQASKVLTRRMGVEKKLVFSSPDAAPVISHLPINHHGWTPVGRGQTKENIKASLQSTYDKLPHKEYRELGREKALAYRMTTILLLGHSGIAGLSAQPSYARQYRNQQPVDGKKYAWDITAHSDGSSVAAGEYRLRVRTQPESPATIHSDLVGINPTKIFSIQADQPEELFAVADTLSRWHAGEAVSDNIIEAQQLAVQALSRVGPASTSRGPLTAQSYTPAVR